MPRNRKPQGKVATIPERIRGGIAMVLTVTAFTLGNYTTDTQLQVTFVIAGMLYMCTTLAYVFENGFSSH